MAPVLDAGEARILADQRPPIVVVAGVSGSGKTTVGRLLADRLGAVFLEGDDLHTAGNIAKMRAGVPLDDADRAPWLRAIGDRLDSWIREGRSGSVSCSALKRAYRDALRRGRPRLRIALLEVPRFVIEARLANRKGHFMPASLLDSQMANLEPLEADERDAFSVDASSTPRACAEAILAALARSDAGA